MISLVSKLTPRAMPSPAAATSSDRTIKIHGRTHITGIELSPWRDTNEFFGSTEVELLQKFDQNKKKRLFE